MTWFFTGCLHFDHTNIIKLCKRPFRNVHEMNNTLIANWNSKVTGKDSVVIAGDFALSSKHSYIHNTFIRPLNGNKIFIRGNHDRWMKEKSWIYEKKIENQHIVVCHYPMRTWNKSHHGAWQLYSHSHGKLEPFNGQWDVSVDNNNYFPVSFEELKQLITPIR